MKDKKQDYIVESKPMTDEELNLWHEDVFNEHPDFILSKLALDGDVEATRCIWQKIIFGQVTADIKYNYLTVVGHALLQNLEEGNYPAADLALNIKRSATRPKGKPKLFRDIAITVKTEIRKEKYGSLDAALCEAANEHQLRPKIEKDDQKRDGKIIQAALDIHKKYKAAAQRAIEAYKGDDLRVGSADFYTICRQTAIELGEDPEKVQNDYIRHIRRENTKKIKN